MTFPETLLLVLGVVLQDPGEDGQHMGACWDTFLKALAVSPFQHITVVFSLTTHFYKHFFF